MKFHTFKPRALTSFQHYRWHNLGQDVGAGMSVGFVALPLAMAFAIASGLSPEAGLFTAIVAGVVVSLLGGTGVQIAGPAGAFIVVVYAVVQKFGLSGLLLATFISGLLLVCFGWLRLGLLIRFIPVAVVGAFTNGIAVLIMASQLKEFLGLEVEHMPADAVGILSALWSHASSLNPDAFALALLCVLVWVLWTWLAPLLGRQLARRPAGWGRSVLAAVLQLPSALVVLVVGTVLAQTLGWEMATIGSRYGGIPEHLPSWHGFEWSWAQVQAVLPSALTFAVLGAIESLLCARVADQLTHDHHDANQELIAQGLANLITPFLAGMPATGTIARTVTNIKSGAQSALAGVVHSLTLVAIVLVGATWAKQVPLACLSAILMMVGWNMGEWRAFVRLGQFRMPYRITFLAVFLLTVLVDLSTAVQVGLGLAMLTFIYRISELTQLVRMPESELQAHWRLCEHTRSPSTLPARDEVQCHRLFGALFFGAVELLERLQKDLPSGVLILDFSGVLYMDSTGLDALMELNRACITRGTRLMVCSLTHQPGDILRRLGPQHHAASSALLELPLSLEDALARVAARFGPGEPECSGAPT